MTSQWPYKCDVITWIVIFHSSDIDFIHGDIHGRSCKKYVIAKLLQLGMYHRKFWVDYSLLQCIIRIYFVSRPEYFCKSLSAITVVTKPIPSWAVLKECDGISMSVLTDYRADAYFNDLPSNCLPTWVLSVCDQLWHWAMKQKMAKCSKCQPASLLDACFHTYVSIIYSISVRHSLSTVRYLIQWENIFKIVKKFRRFYSRSIL